MVALDEASLLRRLTALVAAANLGEGGLPGLQAIVGLAAEATDAAGATFVERGGSGGRVVAATGALDFTLGRPVDAAPEDHGFLRVLRADATVGGTRVGSLQVYFRLGTPVGAGEQALVDLLATGAAHLYTDNRGLPVYDDAPSVTSVDQGVVVVGAGGLVRSWNPAAERLTAVPAADAVGRPPPFPVPPVGQVIEHRLACGRWIQVETAALAGTDSLAVSLRPFSAATAVDSARDLFLAVASHELRTPVTVVRGYADTLIEHWDALDEPARREAVFVLGQRARELARLVDRLLTAASDAAVIVSDDGGVPFELPDALREAIAELNPELRAAVHAQLPLALPKALGERASLATVVTELVTNACKYSPNRVEVELNAGADAQTVWFRVLDRGVGIPPEHVERAFERFWQLDSSDQRRYGGVGLGLYLVRRILERQHGWVSMRPRDGGGTVAEVRLPRADASPGEAES